MANSTQQDINEMEGLIGTKRNQLNAVTHHYQQAKDVEQKMLNSFSERWEVPNKQKLYAHMVKFLQKGSFFEIYEQENLKALNYYFGDFAETMLTKINKKKHVSKSKTKPPEWLSWLQ